ncbi:hypothetical protein LSH36_662g04043 [Paralvinella palmiformis]|uniref:EGF-like domain-containing protein n=1 Tax=Paralvinella palmiformis TaxID=53620 RepID=A0AAD9J409_9ANNE|nr:hypothetical protein LSH36_662g04043 [Paralvinella palmiformis]
METVEKHFQLDLIPGDLIYLITIFCHDINECLDDKMNECHQNATCYNNLGGYSCVCNHGYRDINECSHSDYNDCHEYANCTNTVGSYQCNCLDGYTGNGTVCKGSYLCSCLPGYTGDGRIDGEGCQDIDECKIVIPPVCGTNSNCTNIDGSYVCNCSSTDYYSPANDGKDCIGKFVCVCVCVCVYA